MGDFGRSFSAFYASCSNQQDEMEQPAAGDAYFLNGMQAVLIEKVDIATSLTSAVVHGVSENGTQMEHME